MKYRTTNKAINNGYCYVIRLGYCELQGAYFALREEAYTCGVYGWNANIYTVPSINSACICVGYRPTGNVSPSSKLIKETEAKIESLRNEHPYDYDHARERMQSIMEEFIEKAIEEYRGE